MVLNSGFFSISSATWDLKNEWVITSALDSNLLFGWEVHDVSELLCSLSGENTKHLFADGEAPAEWPLSGPFLYPQWKAHADLSEHRTLPPSHRESAENYSLVITLPSHRSDSLQDGKGRRGSS